ncbi:Uncharacterised protein [Vibrio cholerae]|nr:Uncharacterised protein [Vibrio cholerae]
MSKNTAFVSVVKSTMLVVLRLITMVAHCQKALCVPVKKRMRSCLVPSEGQNGNICHLTSNLNAVLCYHCVSTSNCFVICAPRRSTKVWKPFRPYVLISLLAVSILWWYVS